MKRHLLLLASFSIIAVASSAWGGFRQEPVKQEQLPQVAKFTEVQNIYLSQVGVTEAPEGSNWGPQVSKYLKSVNVYSPAAWCAAFVHWCHSTTGVKDRITAWSPTAENANNLVYKNQKFYQELRPADVGTLYFPSMKRIAHTFFVDSKVNYTVCKTVEGNTNKAGSREGTAVMIKYRSIKAIYSISRWT